MHYDLEYDTTKVDTPENRRGYVRLTKKYGQNEDGSFPVFSDPEGRENTEVTIYLRVLADYSDPELETAEGLEAALETWMQNIDSDTYFVAVFDRLRYADLIYAAKPGDSTGRPLPAMIEHEGRTDNGMLIFTRMERVAEEIARVCDFPHADIDEIIGFCDALGLKSLAINLPDIEASFDLENLRYCIEEYYDIDQYWDEVRTMGVDGEDLFPLLAQDFLGRDVFCLYGSSGRQIRGHAAPYKPWQAPGYNIETATGKTVYVPLDSIIFIQELPDEDEDEDGEE